MSDGIDDESIGKILNGSHKLINVANGIDLIKDVDLDYINRLEKVKSKFDSDIYFKRDIQRQELLRLYKKNHFEFIYHILEDKTVHIPKSLIKATINEENPPIEAFNLSAIDQLSLLLNKDDSVITDLLSDVKFFGFQFFHKFRLFRENSSFGRIKGKIKTIEDKAKLKDTDILFLDINNDISLSFYYSSIEKVSCVIAYHSMRSLLSHHDIFHSSKENYEQVPLILIPNEKKELFKGLINKEITIDLKKNVMSKK